MQELSLHILDIVQNSVKAQSTEISVALIRMERDPRLLLVIRDNGSGMNRDALARAANPFFTSGPRRKYGFGIPFLKQAAEQTGGSFSIRSSPGEGTCVSAIFSTSHIDCPPLGDLGNTVCALIQGNPKIEFVFSATVGKTSAYLRTSDFKRLLDPLPFSAPFAASFIRSYTKEHLKSILEKGSL